MAMHSGGLTLKGSVQCKGVLLCTLFSAIQFSTGRNITTHLEGRSCKAPVISEDKGMHLTNYLAACSY